MFNNSFVQWGAAETLRRVQAQAVFASFCIRAKPKPFSSIVLLEDQSRSNPVADQPDLTGSLTDGMMLSQYVYLAAQRLMPYHDRTLSILAIADLDRIAVLAPKGQASPVPGGSVSGAELTAACVHWLGTAS